MTDPDIVAGIFRLWVNGMPDNEDWLNVIAACDAPAASITVSGAILQMADLRRWLSQLESMKKCLGGEARLSSAEPNIDLSFSCNKLGNIKACLQITPDIESQSHKVFFQLDQSFLPQLIAQLKTVINGRAAR